MANGLRIWDASGNLTLDTSDQVAKILGVYSTSFSGATTTQSGNISNSGFSNGSWFYIITKHPYVNLGSSEPLVADISVTFSGTTLTWSISGNSSFSPLFGNFQIVYGYI